MNKKTHIAFTKKGNLTKKSKERIIDELVEELSCRLEYVVRESAEEQLRYLSKKDIPTFPKLYEEILTLKHLVLNRSIDNTKVYDGVMYQFECFRKELAEFKEELDKIKK